MFRTNTKFYYTYFYLILLFSAPFYTSGQVNDMTHVTIDSLMKIDKEEKVFENPSYIFQVANELHRKGVDLKNSEAILEGLYWQCKVYTELKMFFELSDKAKELETQALLFNNHRMELLAGRYLIFVLENMRDFDKALIEYKNLYQKAVEYNDLDMQMTALTNSGDHYLNFKKDTSNAFINFEKCLKIANSRPENLDGLSLGLAYLNYGCILTAMKYYNESASYYDTAYQWMIKIPSTSRRNDYSSLVAIEIGNCFFQKKQFDKAQQWYEISIQHKMGEDASNKLIAIYTQQKDYKKAFEVSNKFRVWQIAQSDIINKAFTQNLRKVNAIHESERELKQYQMKSRWYLVGVILLIVAITALGIAYFFYKKKAVLENTLLQQNLENEINKKRTIEHELKNKIQDTQNLALEINLRNTIVNDLRSQVEHNIDPLSKNTPHWVKDLHHNINSYLRQDIRQMNQSIEEVNHSFVEKLLTKHPNLTSGDIELCGWLRLNMSSKEIANIRGVETKSVDMSRYRLRQKLGLNREDDIVMFLKNI